MAWEKKISHLTLRLSDTDKQAISDAAKREGLSVSEYLRRAAMTSGDEQPAPDVQTGGATLTVRHVDDIGPDPLWTGRKALEV